MRRRAILDPRRLLLFLSLSAVVFFAATGAAAFLSQFAPIHSPLISSIVDFVCSSDQAAQELIFFHRLESPAVRTVCQVFPLWEVVLRPALVCCDQSPQIGCVFFVTVNSVNSVNVLSFFPPGSALCVSLHGASSFSNNDSLFLLRQFCNLHRQFFVIFGLGISVSFLSSLEALAVSPPFGTLALDSCPLAGVRSSHLF